MMSTDPCLQVLGFWLIWFQSQHATGQNKYIDQTSFAFCPFLGHACLSDWRDWVSPLYYHVVALVTGKEGDGDVACSVTTFCSLELIGSKE